MADKTIATLDTELVSVGANDLIGVWDVAASQYKKAKRSNVVGASITGGGTIALDGYTLTAIRSGNVSVLVVNSWTPSLLLGGANTGMTYANRGGHYTLLGDYCYIMGLVALTAKGSSTGVATIAGLPYQVKDYSVPISLTFNDMALDIASTVGLPRVLNAQYFDLMVVPAAGGKSLTQLNHAWFNNGSALYFSGFYKVA